MFTTSNIQNATGVTNSASSQQQQQQSILKQHKIDGGAGGQQQQEFYYTNVNMIQKIAPSSTQGASTVNLTQLTGDDNKTCYIAQPFGYNYALVNQFQNGITGITVDGRLQVVNKPITNTVSNISFKCDVCGLIFAHLTHLNQHKRIHTQDGSDGVQSGGGGNETITVVTSGGQNLVQAQNIISETGQPLGQIQIVTADSLDQAQQQQAQEVTILQPQQAQQQQIVVQHASPVKKGAPRCSSCGGPRRKVGMATKAGKCDSCYKAETGVNSATIQQQQSMPSSHRAPTQIFVAPDGDVKFELTELDDQDIAANSSTSTTGSHSGGGVTTVVCNEPKFHPVKKRNSALMSKCYKCNGTGVIYMSGIKKEQPQQEQQQPEVRPDKPFQCNLCGGQFSRYSSLWSHRKLHSGEKNHKCSVCGLAFAKAVYLKNHMRIHTGEKPYRCNTCGMQFSQSPHLKNHERTHSGEKPYVCEVCDKGFARHATLWNHRRIHTGEKPYKCLQCGTAFSQAAHLKNHAKVHSGEKPFKCDICSTAFADRFALKRHRHIHEKYGQTAHRSSESTVQEQKVEQMEEDDEEEEEEEDEDPKIQIIPHM